MLCVFQDRIATHILKQLSYDRFCVVNVLDENCKIIKTLTEAEILNALIQKGLRTKYGEILSKKINKELKDLEMKNARFNIKIDII